jgi:DNA-binding transcriptional ArsR family regulator
MTGALPLRPDVEAEDGETTVLSVGDETAADVFEALAGVTAQSILRELYREPSTPAELSDHVDTSLQNVHYHLGRLEEADLVRVVGVEFSRRGVEMDVYAPEGPLVVTLGEPSLPEESADPAEAGSARPAVGSSGD